MISNLRQRIFYMMSKYSRMLEPEDWDILDVGTAGDTPRPDGKPGGNYNYFGEGNNYKTLDVIKDYDPDYVDDICKTSFKKDMWDLVILSQCLEHIYTPHTAIIECYRIIKPGGFLIVDSPWEYRYHPEENFGDWYRYSTECLKRMCSDVGFTVIDSEQHQLLSSVLVKK